MNTIVLTLLVSATHAEVAELSGSVEIRAGQDEFHRAEKGESVAEGSRIRTGETARAILRFADGTQVTVNERSSMLLTHVTEEQKDRSAVVLFFGKLWAKVVKHSGQSFTVSTPNAVAGVRGTEFSTTVGDDGTARVRVTEGKVAVSDDDGEQGVAAGQSVDASDGGLGSPGAPADDDKGFDKAHRDNLHKNGETIAKHMSQKLEERKARAERLTEKQRKLKADLQNAESTADQASIRTQLQANAAELSHLRVRAEGGFGAFDHWAELSQDPAFRDSFAGAGYIREELKRLKKVHATFDALIAEGTDLSMKSMDKMLDDMHKGKPTIKDDKGSAKDLFDEH